MNIVSVKFGLFQEFGHVLFGQILTQPDIVLDGAPATYKNCVLPSVVGMRLSIEREAKKIPLGDFPLCYNSQEAKKNTMGSFKSRNCI